MKNLFSMIGFALLALTSVAVAQSADAPPQITMGDGERNSIQIEGLTREDGVRQFAEVRLDGSMASTFRADSVTLTFPKVVNEHASFLVLHPVMDGRPNGDMVSGFAYLPAGTHENVKLHMDHPADSGRKFLVMLHRDVDNDRTLDFVFVEDGINVEDIGVFEDTHMIAKIFKIP